MSDLAKWEKDYLDNLENYIAATGDFNAWMADWDAQFPDAPMSDRYVEFQNIVAAACKANRCNKHIFLMMLDDLQKLLKRLSD